MINAQPSDDVEPSVVGIIVVGYSSEHWLHALFSSLFPGLPPNWVVCYVNNNSPDLGASIADSYARVRVIDLPRNVGYGRACNAGAREAMGAGAEVLVFLNPDVRARPGVLQELVRTLWNHDEVGIVGPLQQEYETSVDEFNAWSRRIIVKSDLHPPDEFELAPLAAEDFRKWRAEHIHDLIDVSYVNGGAFGITANSFRRVGGFEPLYFLYFDEVELCRQVRGLGLRVVVRPDLVISHKWGGLGHRKLVYHWYRSRALYVLLDPSIPLTAAVLQAIRRLPEDLRHPLWESRITILAGLAAATAKVPSVRRVRHNHRVRFRAES